MQTLLAREQMRRERPLLNELLQLACGVSEGRERAIVARMRKLLGRHAEGV